MAVVVGGGVGCGVYCARCECDVPFQSPYQSTASKDMCVPWLSLVASQQLSELACKDLAGNAIHEPTLGLLLMWTICNIVEHAAALIHRLCIAFGDVRFGYTRSDHLIHVLCSMQHAALCKQVIRSNIIPSCLVVAVSLLPHRITACHLHSTLQYVVIPHPKTLNLEP